MTVAVDAQGDDPLEGSSPETFKNKNGESFSAWLSKVDRILVSNIGLTHRDLPDKPYADYFEDGYQAMEAVKDLWGTSPADIMEDMDVF